MQNEPKNLKENIMAKIHNGEVKMKPKIYFIFGSILTFVGIFISVVSSILLIGILKFSLRAKGFMAEQKLEKMILDFPWWILILAVIFIMIGLYLLKKYPIAYKTKFSHLVIVFVLTIIISGWFIDIIGLNDTLFKKGPMQGFGRHLQGKSINR